MRIRPIAMVMVVLAWTLSGCGPSSTAPSAGNQDEIAVGVESGGRTGASEIKIDGSSTVYPISARMMELYGNKGNGTRITVAYSGTGGGMKKFYGGEIDICDASRAMKDNEKEACSDAGVEFIELSVAYDGLAIVVSKENSWCEGITIKQLRKLWTPDNPAKKWSELDPAWPDEEVVLYGPGVDSGTFDYFTEVVVGEAKRIRSDFSPSEDDNVIVTGVSSNKYALGYFGFAYFEENKDKLKLLGVDSGNGFIKPTLATVSQNTYAPLSRPLFIYVRKSALKNPSTADFVQFYLDKAADAAKTVGYVPVKEEIQQANLEKLKGAL